MTFVIAGSLAEGPEQDWLDDAPIEALECRTLRHLWPRMPRRSTPGKRAGLPASGDIAWKILGNVEAGRLLERTMNCAGRCGTIRVEMFLVLRDGRMVRDGTPRYRYAGPYLRKRAGQDRPLEPLGQDQILGALVQRLYPKLRW